VRCEIGVQAATAKTNTLRKPKRGIRNHFAQARAVQRVAGANARRGSDGVRAFYFIQIDQFIFIQNGEKCGLPGHFRQLLQGGMGEIVKRGLFNITGARLE